MLNKDYVFDIVQRIENDVKELRTQMQTHLEQEHKFQLKVTAEIGKLKGQSRMWGTGAGAVSGGILTYVLNLIGG